MRSARYRLGGVETRASPSSPERLLPGVIGIDAQLLLVNSSYRENRSSQEDGTYSENELNITRDFTAYNLLSVFVQRKSFCKRYWLLAMRKSNRVLCDYHG
jgi:hypothetical protein